MKKMNFTKLPGSILSKLAVLILVLFIGNSVFGQYSMTTCQEAYVQAYGQAGTTYLGAGDDSDYSLTLPFTFNYFGNVTTAGVGTNGYITLGGIQYHSYGSCLPSTYTLGTLFPFQQDLYQTTTTDPASGIYYRTDGVAPNRIFTIEYYRTGHYSAVSGQNATLQVRLYETSNIIRFKYQDVIFGGTQSSYDSGLDAIVGIEGPSSIVPRPYNQWSCNTASLFDGLCIEFAPPPPCVLTVPGNMTVAMDPDICGAVVNFTVSASDNCGPVTVTPPSGSVFPSGTTTVTVKSGFEEKKFTITVNDIVPPVITCPDDIEVTLDPGDCSAVINYDVTVTDNCPFLQPAPTTQFPASFENHGSGTVFSLSGNTLPGGVYFNLTNSSANDMNVTGLGVRFGNPAYGAVNPPQTMQVFTAPTYVGNESNAGAWTNLGPVVLTTIPPYFATGTGPISQLVFTSQVSIPAGQTRGFYIWGATACPIFNWAFGGTMAPLTNGPWTLTAGSISFDLFANMFQTGQISYPNINVQATIGGGGDVSQDEGFASGSFFPIGTTTNCFSTEDSAGNPASCCFDVTVHNYPNPTNTLACNDEVQISVDENCEADVNADMILEGGPYSCYDDYRVEIFTSMPAVTYGAVGNVDNPVGPGSYWVGIYDKTGNNCWGHITVVDKLPPVMECRDVSVTCDEGAGSVTEPAPEVVGYQTIVFDGLNDPIDPPTDHIYTFDYSYLPTGTPVQDVNVIVHIDHAYTGDVNVDVTAPDGTVATAFAVGGCGGNFPINCKFDDEGFLGVDCYDLDQNGGPLVCLNNPGVFNPTALAAFDGHDASGQWTIRVWDDFPGLDGGTIFKIGLEVEVNLPQVVPTDACGPINLTYVDNTTSYYCQSPAQKVKRTWTATDKSGNSTSCVQNISVMAPDLSTFTWPVNWDNLPQNNPMLECDGSYALDAFGNPHPSYTGYPAEGSDYCGTLEVFYNDQVYQLACGKKILREWTVVNDCTGEVIRHTQVIRITDTTAPTFCDPQNIEARTKAYVCESDIAVPAINCLKDNCDVFPRWWVTTNAGILVGDKNLNGYVDINETWTILGVPMGQYSLCYHAIDNCGNETTKCVTLTVIDGVPPIPVCEQFKQVSLTGYGHAKVYADDYDSGSFDNCNPVWFKVLRVNAELVYDGGCPDLNGDDNPKTATNDVWYDDEVYFCCEDVGKQIMVSMRVFDVNPGVGPVNPSRMLPGGDLYGHFNDCWNMTLIECKIPPVLTCPEITITCEESLDPNDNAKLWPGVVSLCGVDLEYKDSRDNSTCGANITRTWTAKGCDKTTTCKQTIKVIGTTPFDPCTIVFPSDKQTHCTADLPDGGKPTWDEFPCNVITSEVINEDTFKFVDGACYKIIREWAVIDWCVYKPNTGAENNLDPVTSARKFNCNTLVKDGYYRYTQILKVVDLIPPQIAVEDKCVGTTDCYAYNVEMKATASDTCNTNEEYWWKYKVENLDCVCEPIQVSYNYLPKPTGAAVGKRSLDKLDKVKEAKLVLVNPAIAGHYKVTWTVGDGCGNATTKEQFFTIADKKAPTPVMVDIATAVMENGMVELKARWFDKGGCGDGCISSFDNCSDQTELYFTFTPMIPNLWVDPSKWANQFAQYGRNFFDPNTGAISTEAKYLLGTAHAWYPQSRSSSRVWLCDYVAESNYYKTIQIYVWDQFALNADCDDNNYDFANVIVNFNHCGSEPKPLVSGNVPLENMTMKATYDEGFFTTLTKDGAYSVGVNADETYKVSGTKDTDFLNGVTTLDLVIIQKYLLGLKSITDGKLLLAADINNNGEVTAADLLEARKVILGTKDRFTNNSWIAVDPQTNSRERAITVGSTNVSGINFDVVKIGDMNKTANALESRSSNSVRLMLDEANVEVGQIVEIPFYAEDFTGVYGAQFTMKLSGTLEELVSGRLDINESNYNVVNGNLIVSFNDANGIDVADGSVLFTLKVRSNVEGNISDVLNINDNVLRSEIYTGKDLEINSIEIGYRNIDGTYSLNQNEPNPFVTTTTIGFELPKAANYTLTVFDVTGKELKVLNSKGVAGYNSVTIDGISTTGVLTYRLESDDFTATKKMVSIK